MSRRDLVDRTGLSGGAVTTVVQELLLEELVQEGEARESSGGRKPVPLSINYGARLSVGIKLMEAGIMASLTDLSSQVLQQTERNLSDTSPDTVADYIADAVETLVPQTSAERNLLIGVGLAMPGFIDVQRGVVVSSHRLGWLDVPIASMISSQIGRPVWVDNDVNAYAIAQNLFGLANKAHSVLTVILGTGIGAAMIIDGKIFRGANFRGGEIGFYPPPGSDTRSLSERFSLSAMLAEWHALSADGPLPDAASRGDPAALRLLRFKGKEIGEIIGLIAQFMDPDTILIGGETLQFGEVYRESIRDAIKSRMLQPTDSILFDTQNDLWTRGAAVLAIDHFFDFERADGVTGVAG